MGKDAQERQRENAAADAEREREAAVDKERRQAEKRHREMPRGEPPDAAEEKVSKRSKRAAAAIPPKVAPAETKPAVSKPLIPKPAIPADPRLAATGKAAEPATKALGTEPAEAKPVVLPAAPPAAPPAALPSTAAPSADHQKNVEKVQILISELLATSQNTMVEKVLQKLNKEAPHLPAQENSYLHMLRPPEGLPHPAPSPQSVPRYAGAYAGSRCAGTGASAPVPVPPPTAVEPQTDNGVEDAEMGVPPEEEDSEIMALDEPKLFAATAPAPPPIAVPSLGSTERAKLRDQALQRVLCDAKPGASEVKNYRLKMARFGGSELRDLLLAQLAPVAPSGGGRGAKDGGGQFADRLLAHLLEFYQEDDGHTLAMHWLYKLFVLEGACGGGQEAGGEAPAEGAGAPGGQASGEYERALLAIAAGLIQARPLREKVTLADGGTTRPLSRLLVEAPALPPRAIKVVEDLCWGALSPLSEAGGAEDPSLREKKYAARKDDAVYLGLTTMWDLIMQRPPVRSECLQMVLKCAVADDHRTRIKALKLITGKLFEEPTLSQPIEEFALEQLRAATPEEGDAEAQTRAQSRGDLGETVMGEVKAATEMEGSAGEAAAPGRGDAEEAGRGPASQQDDAAPTRNKFQLPLIFGLCTKKHSLMRELFAAYGRAAEHCRARIDAVFTELSGGMVRKVGHDSPELHKLIRAPPPSCLRYLLQVPPPPSCLRHLLQALKLVTTDENNKLIPDLHPNLLDATRALYQSTQDVRVMMPMLGSLPKTEVLGLVPELVALPDEDVRSMMSLVLQSGALTPAELLVALHDVEVPPANKAFLKQVLDAIQRCLLSPNLGPMFCTVQVLGTALTQMVQRQPLPLLFMRTMIQADARVPSLRPRLMELLSELISKQVWRHADARVWTGFVKFAETTAPASFPVLLQLPAAKLEEIVRMWRPATVTALKEYASAPRVLAALPRVSVSALDLISRDPSAAVAVDEAFRLEDGDGVGEQASAQIATEGVASEGKAAEETVSRQPDSDGGRDSGVENMSLGTDLEEHAEK
ncbi:hypothetical protein CYMTET_32603 [Cymbomonas tetramitiformis]|uniref:Symplekin C-terminal domain-containing protein n=1 Tax=Cymbomonas tetramitiformis TaxID=36881 RepID=A0AAE0KRR6_9CHLO|nr:hypothetical protein CYMTET_32603 [Cymbomonas tetramitiformis]